MNEETIKFWIRMFEPRTKKWRADKMKELKSYRFPDDLDGFEKIEALNDFSIVSAKA